MTRYRVRFADDDSEFAWRDIEASEWPLAGEKFAEQHCDADADYCSVWISVGHVLEIVNVASDQQWRAQFGAEARLHFYMAREVPAAKAGGEGK